MKVYIATLLISLGLVSCDNNTTTKIEREGKPTIYNVTDNDTEMNDAIKLANQTLNKFNEALKSNNSEFQNFALKTRINADESEHIWVSDIKLIDNKYFGVVGNIPESTSEVKIGDKIQIENDKISDWMYIENQKLRGGYTIRVLRKHMTPAEREEFDMGSGLIIEE